MHLQRYNASTQTHAHTKCERVDKPLIVALHATVEVPSAPQGVGAHAWHQDCARVHVCACMRVRVRTHVRAHSCVHAHVRIRVRMCVHMCVCMRVPVYLFFNQGV